MKYSEKFAHDFNRFVVIGAATKRRFFFQAEDGIRDVERSRGLGDVYKRQARDYE